MRRYSALSSSLLCLPLSLLSTCLNNRRSTSLTGKRMTLHSVMPSSFIAVTRCCPSATKSSLLVTTGTMSPHLLIEAFKRSSCAKAHSVRIVLVKLEVADFHAFRHWNRNFSVSLGFDLLVAHIFGFSVTFSAVGNWSIWTFWAFFLNQSHGSAHVGHFSLR